MANRNTTYAREIDIGSYKIPGGPDEVRIERLFIHALKREEIRFSWWKDGKIMPRALDVTEGELLPLTKDAIENGVFTDKFLDNLRKLLSTPS